MPPKAKKGGKKAGKATAASGESKSMGKWLTRPKETAKVDAMEEKDEIVEDPIVEEPEKIIPPVKRPKRGSSRAAKATRAVVPPEDSESQMEGVESSEMDTGIPDIEAYLNEIQTKAKEGSQPTNSRYIALPIMDEEASAYDLIFPIHCSSGHSN